MKTGRHRVSIEIRFWKQVSKGSDNDCWLWIGTKDKDGYGKIKTNDKKTIRPHRLSWEIHRGQIPQDMHVLHDCPSGDNPSCVNPAHLWLGTEKDNSRDAVAKGRKRTARGEDHYRAKFSDFLVRGIRALYDSGHYTQGELARLFAIDRGQIHEIVRRKSWKHVI